MITTDDKGQKYSKTPFEGYTMSGKVMITTNDGDEFAIDIYTTNTNKDEVVDLLMTRKSDKVTTLKILNWSTKDEDDRTNKLISDMLDDFTEVCTPFKCKHCSNPLCDAQRFNNVCFECGKQPI